MKYFFSLFLFILISLEGYSQNIDELIFENRSCNVGEIKKDSIIVVEFIFKNCSDTIVDIIGIDKSCTCTNVKLDTKKLSPKESSSIFMTVDTKNKKGKFKEWSVLIASTKQRFYKLTVSGEKTL